jgi:hypothetical protein
VKIGTNSKVTQFRTITRSKVVRTEFAQQPSTERAAKLGLEQVTKATNSKNNIDIKTPKPIVKTIGKWNPARDVRDERKRLTKMGSRNEGDQKTSPKRRMMKGDQSGSKRRG